jgi:hypothetical protein
MKRRLFNLAAALSLLLSFAASAAWAMSYARSAGWRLLGIAHSADLTPVNRGRSTALFTTAPNSSKAAHYGFWDALWALSESGRLTLLAQPSTTRAHCARYTRRHRRWPSTFRRARRP